MRIKKYLLLAALLLGASTLAPFAQPATGPPCEKRAAVVDRLNHIFGEHLIGRGLVNAEMLVEVYAGPAGTWTIIVSSPKGVACLLATGNFWEVTKSPDIAS